MTHSSVTSSATGSGSIAAADDLQRRLQDAEAQLEQTRQQLHQTQDRLEQIQGELKAITGSTTWRLTGLVRMPILHLMNVPHDWRQIADRVAGRGGWSAMLSDTWSEMRAYRRQYLSRLWCRFIGQPMPLQAPGSGPHSSHDFDAWYRKQQGRSAQAPGSLTGHTRPLISILMPTYRPPLALLQEAVASVVQQDSPHWELCIADDASGDPALEKYLRELAELDPRVHVVFRERNGHISACTNSALAQAKGDFVLLLDQDDLLTPNAVSEVIACIQANPDVGIIYSDEDRINEDGTVHTSAYFKPDFNYDLFLGQNMVSHLGVFRRDLLIDIGGFREGLEGSQDYDLALRAMERIRPAQIQHIPQVLYHWRAIKGSTALDRSEKSYASTAGHQAVVDHLQRTHQAAEVLPAPDLPFLNRVRYALPSEGVRVTVVIALDASAKRVAPMLAAMYGSRGQTDIDFVLCLSGPGTQDELLDGLPESERPRIELIHTQKGAPLSARVNAALPLTQAPFVVICNALFDRFSEGWLEELVRVAAQGRVGFVAPRVRNRLGLLDHGGILFTDQGRAVFLHKGMPQDSHGYGGRGALQQSFRALSPALLVARRAVLDELGPMNSDFPGRMSLVDKCLEAGQRGLDNVWTPYVDLGFDNPRYSGRLNVLSELGLWGSARRRWLRKWGHQMPDPAYNRNLSRWGDFALNWKD
ncbi:MAG: glycosyltransferase [Burkholderiaceae bacterium]